MNVLSRNSTCICESGGLVFLCFLVCSFDFLNVISRLFCLDECFDDDAIEPALRIVRLDVRRLISPLG